MEKIVAAIARVPAQHVTTSDVEALRNLPLLFQILFWYLAVLGTLPSPRTSEPLLGAIYFTNRGILMPELLLGRGGIAVLLHPDRVVVRERLAPVRHREVRVEALRLLEGLAGVLVLEAVEHEEAAQERLLRLGRARVGELGRTVAGLRERGGREDNGEEQERGQAERSHRSGG